MKNIIREIRKLHQEKNSLTAKESGKGGIGEQKDMRYIETIYLIYKPKMPIIALNVN